MTCLTPIETERLLLRLVEPNDALAFTRMITQDISDRLSVWPFPYTPEFAREKISRNRAAACDGDALPFVITHRQTHDVLGWIALFRLRDNRERGVIGYWLGAAHQGQGLMREAASIFVDEARRRLGLTSIEATCLPDNLASKATLQGLGFAFVREGPDWSKSKQAFDHCLFYERKTSA
jgi:ribosomal-protein-alanine N-acetyltransferase